MELKLSKEQTERVIQTYYQVHESKDAEISSKVTRGCEGLYETPCANVTFTVSSVTSLLGESVKEEVQLSKKEVEAILATMLSEEGYSLDSISYDAGFTTGDFFDRGTRCYFHGVSVSVAKKVDQKVKSIGR